MTDSLSLLMVMFPIFALVVGALARAKNRSFIGWFLLSFLITPLVALLALMFVPILVPGSDDALQ